MNLQIEATIPTTFQHATRQAPFAIALSLTRTARDAQEAIREELPGKFHLRNSWTSRGVRIQRADKQHLEAIVSAPDYMALQETGGTKTPQNGRHIGIPNREALGDGILRAGKRPRGLLDKPNVFLLVRGGERLVAQRMGRKGRKLRILYSLEATQQVAPRFGMFETVRDTVNGRFAMNLDAAFMQAMATAR